jgi:Diguanylate cyclase, GGDEF domain
LNERGGAATGDRDGQDRTITISRVDLVAVVILAAFVSWVVADSRARRTLEERLRPWTGGQSGATDDATQPPAFSELMQQVDRIGKLATTDELTGVANRPRLLSELELTSAAARDHYSWLGLCMLDLDGFKGVNDTLGHDSGDSVLVAGPVTAPWASRLWSRLLAAQGPDGGVRGQDAAYRARQQPPQLPGPRPSGSASAPRDGPLAERQRRSPLGHRERL